MITPEWQWRMFDHPFFRVFAVIMILLPVVPIFFVTFEETKSEQVTRPALRVALALVTTESPILELILIIQKKKDLC